MTLDMVLRYWAFIEADFARFYRCTSPLTLSWRRFLVYLRGLPPTSTFALVTGEERKVENMSATDRMQYYRDKHEKSAMTPEVLVQMANE